MSPSKQSRRARKHLPGRKLSSDTTSTLPEYIPSPGWNHFGRLSHSQHQLGPRGTSHIHQQEHQAEDDVDISWDKPPDYPDSAEEADEDTDPDTNFLVAHHRHHLTPPTSFSPRSHFGSPRRPKFLPPPPLTPNHRRGQSSQSHLLRPLKSLSHHKPRHASERLLLSPANSAPPDSADPYLDSLLERSVHALEMSNTLLQSSISTQTSLSTMLAAGDVGGSLPETMLETHAHNLRSRIQDDWVARAADDLEEITRDVEGLFGGSGMATTASALPTPSTMTEAGWVSDDQEGAVGLGLIIQRSSLCRRESSSASGMSCSLPTESTLSSDSMTWNCRRPFLDLEEAVVADDVTTPGLHFARRSRENLISPPPRPITQYVPSIQLSDEIVLPSTIGVRSPPSIYQRKSVSELASSSTTSLLTVPSFSTPLLPPKLTDKPLEPSTPAYNLLSSFVSRQPSSSGPNTPSTSFTTSFMASIRLTSNRPNQRSASVSPTRLRDRTPTIPQQRPMTPPLEESSSSESCMAKRTVHSLRKILDDQPPPVARTAALGLSGDRLKAPKFMPRTPAPLPEATTSNATASISRLFTKGTHSSSTRAPSPPRLSAMKHSRNNSSASDTPTASAHLALPLSSPSKSSPSSTTLHIPEMVSKVLNGRRSGGATSASSSGLSTPNKRISFAELPESYTSTRPGGAGSSKLNEKRNRKKRKGSLSSGNGTHSDGGLGFMTARWWLGGGDGSDVGIGGSVMRHEDRMEDRMTRGWGARMGVGLFSGGLDDWAV